MIFKVYLMRRGGRKLSWRDTINGPALTLGSLTSRNGVYKVAELITCRRAFKFDHLCALNFDQG